MFIIVFNIFKLERFARFFEPLSSQGSYIKEILIDGYYDYEKNLRFFKIDESLNFLSAFQVDFVSIKRWNVTEEMFRVYTKNERYKRYI